MLITAICQGGYGAATLMTNLSLVARPINKQGKKLFFKFFTKPVQGSLRNLANQISQGIIDFRFDSIYGRQGAKYNFKKFASLNIF